MSNVFISHSSQDKPFVRRLALGLLSEGLPVWLDSWRLSLGDSLLDKIYEGIDSSSVVILVISRHAIESGWVSKELNAALIKEERAQRKFLIPIRIDDCQPPLKIADRLYANFASAFAQPLSQLIRVLGEMGCRDLPVAPERELLGLSFTRGVYLELTSLRRGWGHILRRHPTIAVLPGQIVVNDDEQYEFLRRKLYANIDSIAVRPDYTPELERSLRAAAERVEQLEAHLTRGIGILLNHRYTDDALYWFAKIVRGELIHTLWTYQLREDPENIDYGREWGSASLMSNQSAAEFFETKAVEIVDIWRRGRRGFQHFHLWLGVEEGVHLRDENGVYHGPGSYFDMTRGRDEGKYIFPQMVLEYLRFPDRTGEPIWNLEEAEIGIA